MKRSAVLLFIKYPAPGSVKTRFASEAGQDAAMKLYRCLVHRVMKVLDRCRYPLRICYTPAAARADTEAWLGKDRRYHLQRGEDLGERMKNAFQDAFSEGIEDAVLIGSDVPGIGRGMLADAFGALARCDAVIGPARDGGYYLIGFSASSFRPEVFDDIPWSTAGVRGATCRAMNAAGMVIHRLPLLRDIDTMEDLRLYLAEESACRDNSVDEAKALLDCMEMEAGGEPGSASGT